MKDTGPIEVATALQAAAEELEAPITFHEAMSEERLTQRYTPPPVLNQLPESLARLYAALSGESARPAGSTTEPSTGSLVALGEALELLEPICDALSKFAEDPKPPIRAWAPAHAPVSGLCTWPDEIAWPIQHFEALLGGCVDRPWPTHDDSFLAGDAVPRDRDAAVEGTSPARASPSRSARALLALEWVICATPSDAWPSSISRGRVRALLQGLQTVTGSARCSRGETSVLEFVLGTGRCEPVVSVAAPVESAGLARALTGLVRASDPEEARQSTRTTQPDETGNRRVRVAEVRTPDVSASISVNLSGDTGASCPEPLLLTPRVLTDEGVSRSVLGYAGKQGAVFASLHGRRSVVVHENGEVHTHFTWPHTVNGELPLGTDGAVAWYNGTARWPTLEPGYVMYRSSADDEPVTVELLFRPSVGTWWDGRLYWTSFPSGVGSWAPGEDGTLSLPDFTLLAIHPDESGLLLAPCFRSKEGEYLRRRCTQGWRWKPGTSPAAVSLGPVGAASSHSVRGAWKASAHPEADLV